MRGNVICRKAGWLLLLLVLVAGVCPGMTVRAKAASSYEKLAGGKWVAKKNGKAYKYKKSNGKYAKNGWKKIEGKWYYTNKKGYVKRGLRKIDGKYYYFRETGGPGKTGRLKTGLVTIDGEKYYFTKNGSAGKNGSRIASAWVVIDGEEAYFNQDGRQNPNVMTESEFIKTVGMLAKKDMKKTGILASVTIAQAILESGYGRSILGMEANNLFGMKATLSHNSWKSDWDGKTFKKKTLEYYSGKYVTITADFRAYASIEDSIRDHSNYLRYAKNGKSLRYKGVVKNKSYKKTIQIIKNGGYATDPQYVNKICAIIKKYKLTKYDK